MTNTCAQCSKRIGPRSRSVCVEHVAIVIYEAAACNYFKKNSTLPVNPLTVGNSQSNLVKGELA